MQDLNLTSGERVVHDSITGLTVTNKRVRLTNVVLGRSKVTSITLESIASCSLRTKAHVILLLVGGLLVIAAMVAYLNREEESAVALLVAGAACIVIYFLTRKAVLVFASSGGPAIEFGLRGVGHAKAVEVIDAVENEKLKRIEQLAALPVLLARRPPPAP